MIEISDTTIDSVTFTRNTSHSGIADIVVTKELRPLEVFFWEITWQNLAFFANCVADGIGCGFEMSDAQYDDDLEPDEEPFEGVRVTNHMDNESIVLSRSGYEQLALRFLELCIQTAETENQTIRSEPVWLQILEARERLKARSLQR